MPPDVRRARVLVVDDDEDMCLLVEIVLARAGMDVTRSMDGGDAVRRLEHEAFDAVVLDIMIPDVDGWEILDRLRHRAGTPVVVLSVLADPSSVRRGLRSGASSYLPKPFQPAELVSRVRSVVGCE